jgi:hypothetical protein
MALMGLLCLSGVAAVQAEVPRGVAVTPRNFPHHTAADVDQAFRLAREVGQHAVFIYQWGELNLDIVKAMFAKANQAGLVPVLGLSPTTLDQERKELDLPASVRLQAGANLFLFPIAAFARPTSRRRVILRSSNRRISVSQPRSICWRCSDCRSICTSSVCTKKPIVR